MSVGFVLATCMVLASPDVAHAQANCGNTSTGQTAIPDLAGGSFMGMDGGLYPGGTNEPPSAYQAQGEDAANSVVPLDREGRPDPDGAIVLMSVGMSNAMMEFQVLVGTPDPLRDAHVALVNGAQGGYDAKKWADASFGAYDNADAILEASGFGPAQVQAIWLKETYQNFETTFDPFVTALHQDLRTIVQQSAVRWPNLRLVLVSPRTYGGYVSDENARVGEPFAYWTGFADKLLVQDSVEDPVARPWIGWGPYIWTDGTRGRSDGLTWTCADVHPDNGTHPTPLARAKVAEMLAEFLHSSPFTAWYRGQEASPPASPPVTQRPSGEPSPSTGSPSGESPPLSPRSPRGTRGPRAQPPGGSEGVPPALILVGGLVLLALGVLAGLYASGRLRR